VSESVNQECSYEEQGTQKQRGCTFAIERNRISLRVRVKSCSMILRMLAFYANFS
jgi:hypothetical protein